MVFVQTCRGPSTMELVKSDFKISELAVQQDADMLIAYSTTEGRKVILHTLMIYGPNKGKLKHI
jgi:hypothetical protein